VSPLSLTFFEDGSRSAREGDEKPDDAFRSAFTTTVGALIVLCGVFLALGYFQPPQLSEASIDLSRATSEPGQQLRLFLNGPVDSVDASQVSITPFTEFTVSTTDDLIALQFAVPLNYNALYTIDIIGVTSADRDLSGDISHEFTTGSSEIVYLDRGAAQGELDQLIRTDLAGTGGDVLYKAGGISDFAVLENSLVVSRIVGFDSAADSGAAANGYRAEGTSSLELASLVDRASETILLPGSGLVDDLRVAPGTSRIAFTLTSLGPEAEREFDNTLMTVDFDSGRTVVPVVGLAGEPLSVLSWSFIPGSTSMLVQLRDQSVFVIDPTGAQSPTPLGRLATLGRLSMDGSRVVAVDPFGSVVVSLVDGSEQPVEPSLVDGEFPYFGDVQPLSTGSLVQRVAILDPVSGRFSSMLVFDDTRSARVLYQTVDSSGSIIDFALSPNEQFVAIEVVPVVEGSESDDRKIKPRATSVTTVIVELATGVIVRSFEGFAPKW
jgi:hypothetical protein